MRKVLMIQNHKRLINSTRYKFSLFIEKQSKHKPACTRADTHTVKIPATHILHKEPISK